MANILGINLSELNKEATLNRAAEFLASNTNHYIVTPNPEIILEAHRDEEFFYILNQADLSLADGMGLKIAAWLMHEKIYRQTGADFTLDLLKLAEKNRTKTLILNWSKGLSSIDDISLALKIKYPNLNFLILNIEKEYNLSTETINQINDYSPALAFNTLGFPWQEKLMYYNKYKLASLRLMLGIGGSFDFISGKIKRAPRFLRAFGLEWFWRLINAISYQDSWKRIKRIYRATVVFMLKVLKSRFINPFLYRPNVACFVYKKTADTIKILLVERTDEQGHWQLPQGGTDGEDLATAGKRELKEEVNISNLINQKVFPNVSSYIFPKKYWHQNHKIYKYDYKGQKQGLFVAEFTGDDSEIKTNYWDHRGWQWLDLDQALNTIHPVRQKNFQLFLEKFKSLNI